MLGLKWTPESIATSGETNLNEFSVVFRHSAVTGLGRKQCGLGVNNKFQPTQGFKREPRPIVAHNTTHEVSLHQQHTTQHMYVQNSHAMASRCDGIRSPRTFFWLTVFLVTLRSYADTILLESLREVLTADSAARCGSASMLSLIVQQFQATTNCTSTPRAKLSVTMVVKCIIINGRAYFKKVTADRMFLHRLKLRWGLRSRCQRTTANQQDHVFYFRQFAWKNVFASLS